MHLHQHNNFLLGYQNEKSCW
jgi:hypothetical protein